MSRGIAQFDDELTMQAAFCAARGVPVYASLLSAITARPGIRSLLASAWADREFHAPGLRERAKKRGADALAEDADLPFWRGARDSGILSPWPLDRRTCLRQRRPRPGSSSSPLS